MSNSVASHHTDWLSLVEISGPFLTLPVLKRALPQGLEPLDRELVDELRRAHQELQDDGRLQDEWVRWVLASLLGFTDETLRAGPAVPATLEHVVSEHGETLRADLLVVDPVDNGKIVPRMLVTVWSTDTNLNEKLADRRWAASPLERMAELLRGKRVQLGLVTNGERWTLVHAALGGPTTYATWEAGIWLEDRPTLNSFTTLLSAARFFGKAESDTLEALFEESASAEQEVTDQLGKQVRQAVELIVDAFGRANREYEGKLLEGTSEAEIYSAAVTVMMRLVFLLCAEERGLFLLGDPLYDTTYAVSTLRAQLQEEADQHGEDPLEKRSSAWHRLLATFRMVHTGVEHENLRLPAYGGTLFDPNRFPFLEGRKEGELWPEHAGRPLPLDDRTLLHILDALQVLRFRERGGVTEARRLSFRALDVEQIGHVYEGLLDHTVIEATGAAVGLKGKLEPEIPLAELEARSLDERDALIEWLVEKTGLSKKAIDKALNMPLEPHDRALLVAACDMDGALADRIAPFHALLRRDLRGLPQVYLAGGVYVTQTLERRSSGTYYTPRSLAEEMVRYALEPLVYKPGPAEGADPAEWRLLPPAELLELKICDMAMGSGAFLVASCRYLGDRLTEAWGQAGNGAVTVEGEPAAGRPDDLLVPDDPDDRAILASRLIVDRCLYGVDKNPMAVEMAKLSMWLVTLAKDRPFSFVDHALRCGDSLLGITDLEQIENLHIDPARGRELFHGQLFDYKSIFAPAIERAIDKRRALEAFPVVTVRDAQDKERLFHEAEQELEALKVAGDVIIGAAISTASQGEEALERRLLAAADDVAAALDPERKESDRNVRLESLHWDTVDWLNTGRPIMKEERRTFHWPLEFPEVFVGGGFDAIVGNPPFLGNKYWKGSLGIDIQGLVRLLLGETPGKIDLSVVFLRRGFSLLKTGGALGLLTTAQTAEGEAISVGLGRIQETGTIYRAHRSQPWPGQAKVRINKIWAYRGRYNGSRSLDGASVAEINPRLTAGLGRTEPLKPKTPELWALEGIHNSKGEAFLLREGDPWLQILRSQEPGLLRPYLSGEDLAAKAPGAISRWAVCTEDMSLDEISAAFPLSYKFLTEVVKPTRTHDVLQPYKGLAERWWQFWNHRAAQFRRLRQQQTCLAIPKVVMHIMCMPVSTDCAFTNKVVLIELPSPQVGGVLASSLFGMWIEEFSTSFGAGKGLSVSVSKAVNTFPLPTQVHDDVADLWLQWWQTATSWCVSSACGFTTLFNRIHSTDESDATIPKMRSLMQEIDQRVCDGYGIALALDYDVRPTAQGSRFTVSPEQRTEVLNFLLELNHERLAPQLAVGQHGIKRAAKTGRNGVALDAQTTLEGIQ